MRKYTGEDERVKVGREVKHMALTPKQQAFIQEYLVDLNSTASAIRAGYSARNADKIGPELLGKTRIKEAIQQAIEARAKRTGITADRVLNEYAKIAFADIKDFLSFKTENTSIGVDDDGKVITAYQQIINVKPSDSVDGTMIQEVSISPKGVFAFKLHDKKGALDMIGKHLGMFIDKTELTGKNGGKIELDVDLEGMSDDDLLKTIETTSNIINSLQKRVSPKD